MDPTIVSFAGSRHEPVLLHAVEVVRQGGAFDPDRVGQLALCAVTFLLEGEED
jgi:hypothetical protein